MKQALYCISLLLFLGLSPVVSVKAAAWYATWSVSCEVEFAIGAGSAPAPQSLYSESANEKQPQAEPKGEDVVGEDADAKDLELTASADEKTVPVIDITEEAESAVLEILDENAVEEDAPAEIETACDVGKMIEPNEKEE